MARLFKLLFSLIYLLLIYNLFFAINIRYNEGFNFDTLDKIQDNATSLLTIEHSIDKEELNQILDQPFYYLAKGAQAYVFISKDGRYVVKLFKGQHYNLGAWLKFLRNIPFVSQSIEGSIERKAKRRADSFQSYMIAYNKIPEETGVLFLQIDDNSHGLIESGKEISVTDHLGEQYFVNLSETNFMIQYTADMVWPRIESEMRLEQDDEARKLISKMIEHIFRRCSKGVANMDVAFGQNHGYIDDRAILVDVGCLVEKNFIEDYQLLRQEVYKSLRKFRIWIERFYPELIEHFYYEIDSQLKEYDPYYTEEPKEDKQAESLSGN